MPKAAFAAGATPIRLGKPSPFAFDGLVGDARSLASKPYAAPVALPAAMLDAIDYEALGYVHYDPDFALFKDGPGQFPVTFFMLGRYSRTPVHVHALTGAPGVMTARELIYDPGYFRMPADSPARKLPSGAGFAGFRIQESRFGGATRDWRTNDWAAFLGASYFRAIGALHQYGLSARGVAIDVVAPDRPEEFPAFTRFYIAPTGDHDDSITVYALLEGPSVTGAYRFLLRRDKAVVMDVEAHLFLRRDVERLGLAPLTSMYWYSETAKPTAIDWRPEAHDSDGLAMWTGKGERIWRPLNDPPAVAVSAFADAAPRGFGLMQRDRNFDHYLDGVHYERRPSLWVEPLDDWGEGAVQLIEIPTDDEINDNIVLCWVPKARASAGSAYHLRYRLHWSGDEPFPSEVAPCVATRIGRGGQPGRPRPKGVVKFVVEFLGKSLAGLPFGVLPEAVVSASSGSFTNVFTEAVPDDVGGHWRAEFDFTPVDRDPVEMRLYLKARGQTLTETWLYRFHPQASAV
ncbi:MAG: glucan biosynthesis protein D [Sphingomonadaceae bacterium]|nr:glucan biosynthesis protein D [Sphingomonadaceae bacterium]